MRLVSRILTGVGGLGLSIALGAAPPAQAAPAVQFGPATWSASPGDTLEVVVSANAEMPPLSCFAFTLDYDPAVLRLVDAAEGSLFAGALPPTFFSVESDSLDRNVVSNCVLGFGTSVTPPGEIAVLRFEALAAGSATVTVDSGILRDVDRIEIAGVVFDSLAVTVGATATPPPVGPAGLRLGAEPNPTASIMQLRLGGAGPSGARAVEIYDLAGRRVRTLAWPDDRTGAAWDGRDASGRKVGAGVYFAVMRTPQGPLRTKLVRLD